MFPIVWQEFAACFFLTTNALQGGKKKKKNQTQTNKESDPTNSYCVCV